MSSAPASAVPPAFFEENALYDFIMAEIEPELTSASIPSLRQKYEEESPEQRAVRLRKYQDAFRLYDERFAAYTSDWTRQMHKQREASLVSMEKKSKSSDDKSLSTLEHSILSV